MAPPDDISSVTNIARVGWQVLAVLERAVDVRSAIFVVSLRFRGQVANDTDYFRQKLESSSLSGRLFKSEIENAFHLIRVLDSNAPDSELRDAVAASIALDEGAARDLFLEIVKGIGRPRSDVARQVADGNHVKCMTQREAVLYMAVYAYFKAELMRCFSNYLVDHVELDSSTSNEMRKVRYASQGCEEDCSSSTEEIDFVSSVVREGRQLKQ